MLTKKSACSIVLAFICIVSPAFAKDFVYGGRVVSCQSAGKYRDNQLFVDFASAIDNFDSNREKRIEETIKSFKVSVTELSKEIENADEAKTKRISAAVGGVVLGAAATKVSTVGVKQQLSLVEKKALDAVANRGAEWTSIFLKYGVTGDVDVVSIVALPVSFLISFSPYGTAEKVWSLGNTSIDIAFAIAEAEIIKGQSKIAKADLLARAESLAKKLQKPRIDQIILLKNEIDRQCG
jgi:hypothetical protein